MSEDKFYKVSFISGNSLRLISLIVPAEDERQAVYKAFEKHGAAFENRLVSVGLTTKPKDMERE